MRKKTISAWVLLGSLCAVLASTEGCQNDEKSPVSGEGACDGRAVLERAGCTGCHAAAPAAGLDLRADNFEKNVVGVPSMVPGCEGRLLVDPQHPEQSQILAVLTPAEPGALCSVSMPPTGMRLSTADIECVKTWLESFASDQLPLPFEPAAVESALSKVKMLTVGSAPTADELAQVKNDPALLRSLIMQWQEMPEYEQKTKGLLRYLLQTKQMPTDWAQVDGFNHAGIPQELADAMEQSVLRTAWDIIVNDRPFIDIFTTRRWAVTTAQLVMMRYTDQTQAERDALQHVVVLDPNQAPQNLQESIKTGRWFEPNMPNGCRDKEGPELKVFEILRFQWGHLRCRNIQDFRFYNSAEMNRSGSDYNDFRFVEFTQGDPNAPVDAPPFWDLPAWRQVSTTVESRLPRVGFMTTPQFFNNWSTNEDNQFRLTINQTMIVGLHSTFRVGEQTTPLVTDGIPTTHTDANSDCYGCHRQMDPARSYFQNNFGSSYQSVRGTLASYDPGFAFGGVSLAGGDFETFAQTLAQHPMVAQAWTQKLCWAANGAPCNTADPEFVRIAKAWKDSNFSWKTLIVELYSSPLVTGLAPTTTWENRDLPVSIVRGQHLCSALDTRAGGLCDKAPIRATIGLIPNDNFSRAQVDPDVPIKATAFSMAALESLCTRVATTMIGKSGYEPNTPETTIPNIAEKLIGVPVGHSRHDILVAGMKEHFEEAQQMGLTAAESMQSALILGCMSPDGAGMGL